MKTSVRRWVFLLAGLLFASATAADGPAYGVCRQQMEEYVREQLGQTVTRIDIRTYTTYSLLIDHGDALVYVEECDGFHAFEIYGTETVCEHIPHYGRSIGVYVRYEGGYEGCRDPR